MSVAEVSGDIRRKTKEGKSHDKTRVINSVAVG